MKKSLVIITLCLSGAFFFQASAAENILEIAAEKTTIQTEEFVEITFDQVLPSVKTTLETYLKDYEINLIEFNAQRELTRITLNPKSSEKDVLIVTFDKDGQIL